MDMCVCGHSKEEHDTQRGCLHGAASLLFDCKCDEYSPANLLTVTIILKDGMEKSDHAIDVEYSAKTVVIDWIDGTTTYAKVKTIETLLVTA